MSCSYRQLLMLHSVTNIYINYIYADPCVIIMYIAENTGHFNPEYRILAYFKYKIATFGYYMTYNLYYALHFEANYLNYAGVWNNIVDISVQIAPNKETDKSRPASHKIL